MTQTVVVVDYESGNLRSVANAVAAAAVGLGIEVRITQDPQVVLDADRVVLPGQGHFADCTRALADSGLLASVLHAVANKPLFGVCVGMQMLLTHSEEGDAAGLNIVPGQVRKFNLAGQMQQDGSRFKVPQMGWNTVAQLAHQGRVHSLWNGVADHSWFYFVHSFCAQVEHADHCAGQTVYGKPFVAALAKDNVFATQFHPEKSAKQGLQLYRNFLQWSP